MSVLIMSDVTLNDILSEGRHKVAFTRAFVNFDIVCARLVTRDQAIAVKNGGHTNTAVFEKEMNDAGYSLRPTGVSELECLTEIYGDWRETPAMFLVLVDILNPAVQVDIHDKMLQLPYLSAAAYIIEAIYRMGDMPVVTVGDLLELDLRNKDMLSDLKIQFREDFPRDANVDMVKKGLRELETRVLQWKALAG